MIRVMKIDTKLFKDMILL